MSYRRGKSPARTNLKRVEIGDPSEANVAGSDDVQKIQTAYVKEFVEFVRDNMHSSVQIGNAERMLLAFKIPVSWPNGFSGINTSLVKISAKYPHAKFNMDRRGTKGHFSLSYTSVYGPRDWGMFALKITLLVIWSVLWYYSH